MAEHDDELTPIPGALPGYGDLPMMVLGLQQQLRAHAAVLRALRNERDDLRKGFRNVWIGLVGVSVTIVIAAAGALLQMGAYMERIDTVAEGQRRVEARVDVLVRAARER